MNATFYRSKFSRMVHCLLLAAIAVISANWVVGKVWGFEKSGMYWHGASPMGENFTVCLENAPENALSAIKAAAEKWKYAKFKFSIGTEKCIGDPSWIQADGINYIAFGVIGKGDRGNDAAEAFYWNTPETDQMIECDIRFNKDKKWSRGAGLPLKDQNDLLSVAVHEFGHCLGLDHSNVAGAVMSDLLKVGDVRRDLSQDDKKGRSALYGSP